ncbi:MAG TPA: ATP-dependent RNA helicase HrpA [Opitutaceae bacterium]|nr:ATP-dependent RNA helicase HrpA [Opitutaceae bacterium]
MPSRPKNPWPFRIEYPPELPISARVDEIVTAIQRHPVVVLAGETGSGKTTQIPKMCLAAGRGEHGRIACTQPRRVAATSISRRVAEELGVPWGREVGCKIRFADQTTDRTVIKFMTDGMLLAELQADPDLREYDTIIVDEAHERSLNIDFILGHLRRLRARRPDLKIVITSATIDTQAFAAAFDGAPVIEVSGRVYPVEVIWSPLEEMKGDEEELTYLDGALEAVQRILRESAQGDILVFLPTERDIRELADRIEGAARGRLEVVPLFGRLTNAEQQRVFAPSDRRKVVVATNIAETSLTIPGIRFVVDSGLARVSRYAPQSRTRRLPIEPVAQSSADQRKGRCGRVSDGVCLRLYAEQDFNDRPRFAQPEIQRSNLADVILRMKAFGLGDIEDFPFLNAPPARGIRAGYALLEELGALVKTDPRPAAAGPESQAAVYELTDLGRELANLPVDPTIGRMLLQAREEKCLRELLVIAAALSIQDPRERPLDQQAKADAAHRRFTHPDSDFLTLLAIWEAYHDEFEAMTLGKLRKFCTAHFLSFLRMREWRDVHAQLTDMFRDRAGFVPSSVHDGLKPGKEPELAPGTPAYAAIHRSILAGLLGNIATRGEDGVYHATHDRRVAVFPGSALHEKTEGRKPAPGGRPASGKPRAARWIMAAEIMETGRVYARTCARIDPQWALALGAHLLRVSHSEPFWNPDAGRVLVKERRRLYNLELEVRSVGYGRIAPREATEIFIREGLVGDTITWPFDFLAHNRRLRERTEAVLTRARSAGYMNVDEAIFRFYARHLLPAEEDGTRPSGPSEARRDGALHPVSSVPELIDLVRHRQMTEPKFLFMSEADLRLPEDIAHDAAAFPASVPLENRALPLHYAYKPGREDDGVTLRIAPAEVAALPSAALDWAVPGHLPEKIEILLKALPKEQRRGLIPLAETARSLADRLALIGARSPAPALTDALAEALTDRLGVRIDPRVWADKPLPDHLRVRVEVVDARGEVVGAGRDLAELQRQIGAKHRELSRREATADSKAWQAARAKWETEPAADWKFGDVPESVAVAEQAGVPVKAYPGLQELPAGTAVRLFATPEEARAATRAGLRQLLGNLLRHELGWLERDLRDLRAIGPLAVTLAPVENLQKDAFEGIRRWATGRPLPALTAAAFARELGEAKAGLRGVVPRLKDLLEDILSRRLALQTHKTPYPGLPEDLAQLLPPDFLRRTPFERLPELPRYLQARQLRADRWKRDPAKDSGRARELQPFVEAVKRLGDRAGDLRWLVEEFRVSLFAQELGTAEPVSAVRLERALEELAAGRAPAAGAPARKAAVLPAKGKTVLKSLDALGNLPR